MASALVNKGKGGRFVLNEMKCFLALNMKGRESEDAQMIKVIF